MTFCNTFKICFEHKRTRIMPVTQTAKKIFKQFNFDMENASNECIASQRKFILNICFLVMTYNFPLKLVSSLLTLKCFKTFSKRWFNTWLVSSPRCFQKKKLKFFLFKLVKLICKEKSEKEDFLTFNSRRQLSLCQQTWCK